jgi:hypothetical protein
MTANREFAGRRALVTGGTKGIGQAVAAKLRRARGAGQVSTIITSLLLTSPPPPVARPSPMRCAIGWAASTSSSTL